MCTNDRDDGESGTDGASLIFESAICVDKVFVKRRELLNIV